MTSTVSPNRKRIRSAIVSAAVATVVLGAGWSRAQASDVSTDSRAGAGAVEASPVGARIGPFADRFPDAVLKAHDGRNVRFYTDLLKDKIVLINFMYATCTER